MPISKPLPEETLDSLALAMATGQSLSSNIEAGYTYIGQMIAHDIAPGSLKRAVAPYLTLDSVYGAPQCRDLYFDGDKFRIGSVGNTPDLHRDTQGVAVIPDERNDENVIVSQLHLLWQRIHNKLLDRGYATSFDEARRLVVLLFQFIVIEDYLKSLLSDSVFNHYFRNGGKSAHLLQEKLPAAFTHAAFRFGHSMVRNSYQLQDRVDHDREVSLFRLFQFGKHLDPDLSINWKFFFGGPSAPSPQEALKIDSIISLDMREIRRSSRNEIVNIISRNLKAANDSQLPNGYELLAQLERGRVDLSQLGIKRLVNYGTTGHLATTSIPLSKLPLWPYILEESAQAHRGRRSGLGGLGSLICCDVLHTSIQSAPISVFSDATYTTEAALDSLGTLGEDLMRTALSESNDLSSSLKMHHVIQHFNL